MEYSKVISRKGGQGGMRGRKKFRAEVVGCYWGEFSKVVLGLFPGLR